MGYQPKIIRGKVKGTGYPIDGRELIFSLWDYDNHENYHLSGWNKEDDEAVMMTIYQSENETGMKRRQVYRYIEVAEKLPSEFVSSGTQIGIKKLYLLTTLSDEERSEIIENTDLDKYGWTANPGVWVYGLELLEVE